MTADGLPPCRLQFAFAAEAPVAVVLRRGPSRWVQMLRWDATADAFEAGQWLHGRIVTFDVSPDGAHVLYYVSPHARRPPYSWVALSRPPLLTALAVWPMPDSRDTDCAFVDDRHIAIRPGATGRRPTLAPGFRLRRYALAEGPYRWDWDWRMRRDGWTADVPPDHPAGWGCYFLPWSKPSPDGRAVLHLQNHQGGGRSYQLDTPEGARPLPDATQADWDPRGRLVAGLAGRLAVLRPEPEGGFGVHVLVDLNDQRPEPVPPPPGADRW